jgi:alanine-glyoxylate transaminase/serine-glyoxylate transaminase/serine-pyruvate transaminase
MPHRTGPHFIQTPGPSNVPGRVLEALARPTIDHRGQDFADLTLGLQAGLRRMFRTEHPVIVYPSSGTGAWEAALVNCLSPGDRILAFETGHFATLWRDMAARHGLVVDFVAGDWRHGVDPQVVEDVLARDRAHEIRAVTVIHNETSTGVCSPVPDVRAAMDRLGHPALLLVDTISSLGSIEFEHDAWRVDVAVGCSQKGLMLPPGLGFNAVSPKALAAAEHAGFDRSYWDWRPVIEANQGGFYPYTLPTNLLVALSTALEMIEEEGMPRVLERHRRHAAATRAAVAAWGLEVLCADPRAFSQSVTAVLVPDGIDAAEVNRVVLESGNIALGAGLGRLAGRVFRIGHLGYLNDAWMCGVLSGVAAGLRIAGVQVPRSGVDEALAAMA